MKENSKIWTEKTAKIYLKEHNISNSDIGYALDNAYQGFNFKSDLFDFFVKGYKIKPDVTFAVLALQDALYPSGKKKVQYGSSFFDYKKFAQTYAIVKKIPNMPYKKIHKYSTASDEELDALFYIAEKYPEIDPFKIMDLAAKEKVFEPNKLDFDKFNKILNLLEQGVCVEAIQNIFENFKVLGTNTFDEKAFKEIEKIADIAINKKETFLSASNRHFKDSDIRNFIYLRADKIKRTLNLTDESTLLAAMDLKMNKFDDFISAADRLNRKMFYCSTNILGKYFEALYPQKSIKVQTLQNTITNLKKKFATMQGEELEDLKDKINTKTLQLRNVLKNDKKLSPQEKIEKIEVLSNFDDEDVLDSLLEVLHKKDKKAWDSKIYELMVSHLGEYYNQNIEEKLHLATSPYLGKLFNALADDIFKEQFEDFLLFLGQGDFSKSLDALDHNIATQNAFKNFSLNYEKWTHPKTSVIRSFYDGANLVEIRQVNMRDVAKTLFLGNEVGVCTAVGSIVDEYAIPYMFATMVGAVEVLVNGKVVGNSMLMPITRVNLVEENGKFVAKREPSILIDELKIFAPHNRHKYLQEVVSAVEDIGKDIGIKDGKTYIASSNVITFKEIEGKQVQKIYLIGESYSDIFLNALSGGANGGEEEEYMISVLSSKRVKNSSFNEEEILKKKKNNTLFKRTPLERFF